MKDTSVQWVRLMKALLASIGSLFAISCASNVSGSDAHERDIAIFKAVVQSEACSRVDSKIRVISDLPAILARAPVSAATLSAPAMYKDLFNRSQTAADKWPHIEVCDGARVVASAKIEEIFKREQSVPPGWNAFFEEFPKAVGLVKISLPALSQDGRKALVYMETSCDVLCGAGFYLELMRPEGGEWRVTHQETAWMS
jgi:hypothetical protein